MRGIVELEMVAAVSMRLMQTLQTRCRRANVSEARTHTWPITRLWNVRRVYGVGCQLGGLDCTRLPTGKYFSLD